VAAALRAEGGDVTALPLDLEDESSIRALIEEIARRSGRLDVLVNNAVTRCACGGWDLRGGVRQEPARQCVGIVLPDAIGCRGNEENGRGGVINIGSYMGLRGPDPLNYVGDRHDGDPSPIYFYEKGGMANFTRFAASVLGPFNIRVNAIHPGGFLNNQPEAFVRNYSANTMLGRLANETDLKGAVIFLASDASLYLTGANIPVDGGIRRSECRIFTIDVGDGAVRDGVRHRERLGKTSFDRVCEIVRMAYENGVTALDTAAAYGTSEEVVGAVWSAWA
jgi:NAD(P)-dependent dehydrogenase (short-subunit alcohol dehydrogenase family)